MPGKNPLWSGLYDVITGNGPVFLHKVNVNFHLIVEKTKCRVIKHERRIALAVNAC